MIENALPQKRRPKRPGEIIIAEFLRPLNRSQQQLADALAIDRARMNAILKGRRAVTLDTALRLEKVLGPSALFWLTLQHRCELWDASRDPESNARYARLQPLPPKQRKRRFRISKLTWETRGNPWHAQGTDV